jgi:glycosyltransferase involved in cell wall biosynthesis
MRLLLDAACIDSQPTGIGQYALGLLLEFIQIPDLADINLRGILAPRVIKRNGCPIVDTKTLSCKLTRRSVLGASSLFRLMTRLAISQVDKGLSLADNAMCLYHATNFISRSATPYQVHTLHDTTIWDTPQTHPRERVKYFEKRFVGSLNRATAFITHSNVSKKRLVELFPEVANKITVIHLAAANVFRRYSQADILPVLRAYDLVAGNFFLSVGTMEPRKNLNNLLKAYDAYRAKGGKHPLVVVGRPGWNSDMLDARLRSRAASASIRVLHYISTSDLAALYSGASALVYISILEGFGLPVAEASACECPVIISAHSAMLEIESAERHIVPHDDVGAICEALQANESRRFLRGTKEVSRRRWRDVAKETARVYENVLQNKPIALDE